MNFKNLLTFLLMGFCTLQYANACSGVNARITAQDLSGGTYKFYLVNYAGGYLNLLNRSVKWDFGDGNVGTGAVPQHSFAAMGRYTVNAIAKDTVKNCSDTFNYDLCYFRGNHYPVFSVSGMTVTINSNCVSNQGSYWDMGNGKVIQSCNFSYTYTKKDFYTISLHAIKDTITGCVDSFYKDTTIDVTTCGFTSNFNVNNHQSSITTTYANAYPYGPSSGFKIHNGTDMWVWGNDTAISSNKIKNFSSSSHLFKRSGTYTLCHIVVDSIGSCGDSTCKQIKIDSCLANPNFTYTITGKTVKFTTDPGLNAANWNFGGSISSGQSGVLNPTVTYVNYGTYKVCLDAYSKTCTNSKCTTIFLNACGGVKATPAISKFDSCNKVSFVNNSTGSNLKYIWNFGDSATSKIKSPKHTYAYDKNFLVKLIAWDSTLSNCKDSGYIYVRVRCRPCDIKDSLDLSYDTAHPYQATLHNYSTGTINRHTWYFGDGYISHAATPTHTYTKTGGIVITYIAEDTIHNCADTTYIYFAIDSLTGRLKRAAFTLNVVWGNPQVSVKSVELSSGIKLYPNPFRNEIKLQANGNTDIRELVLLDATGKEIPVNYVSVNGLYTITTDRDMDAGMYILKIRSVSGVSFVKMFKE